RQATARFIEMFRIENIFLLSETYRSELCKTISLMRIGSHFHLYGEESVHDVVVFNYRQLREMLVASPRMMEVWSNERVQFVDDELIELQMLAESMEDLDDLMINVAGYDAIDRFAQHVFGVNRAQLAGNADALRTTVTTSRIYIESGSQLLMRRGRQRRPNEQRVLTELNQTTDANGNFQYEVRIRTFPLVPGARVVPRV
ncbi:hypothetical protein PFISCL1PPCAC_22860, partial [Pristionchus fissidentatus]